MTRSLPKALLLVLLAAPSPRAGAADLLELRSPRPLQAEASREALVPWETPLEGLFVRTHHPVPAVDPGAWILVVDGLVERPLRLSAAELGARPRTTFHAVLECAGNGRGLLEPPVPGLPWARGAVGNLEWSGVALREILAMARPLPAARFGRVQGADDPATPGVPGFVRSVPLEKLLAADTLLAVEANQAPLPVLHGGPLRLILPGWYGQNWTKWLVRLTLEAGEDQGFFMKKGYRVPKEPLAPGSPWDSTTGTPIQQLLVQALLTAPAPGQGLATGPIAIEGKAFSGGGPVARVDLSLDQGASWLPADLDPPDPRGGWQAFRAAPKVERLGPLEIWARAADSTGAVQPLTQPWNPGGYLRNAVDRLRVEVLPAGEPAGEAVVAGKCLMCHAGELIASQRLSPRQWGGVLDKMHVFGLDLTPGEREAVVRYLGRAGRTGPGTPVSLLREEAALAAGRPRTGDAGAGAALYGAACATCHGAVGEGGPKGPRLAGRAFVEGYFERVVGSGLGTMPSFAASLAPDRIRDLAAFLVGPGPAR